jgi:hypothetical protein
LPICPLGILRQSPNASALLLLWRYRLGRSRRWFSVLNLPRRDIDDELGKLGGVAGALGAFGFGDHLSKANLENADNFAGRIRQTKAVWFFSGVAPGHSGRPTLGASDHLSLTRQDRYLRVDGRTSSEPHNSEHSRLLLPAKHRGTRWLGRAPRQGDKISN